MKTPPPKRPAIQRVPCEHEICLDTDNSILLTDYIIALDRWSRRTWAVCEPLVEK